MCSLKHSLCFKFVGECDFTHSFPKDLEYIKYFENPSFLRPVVRCGWEDGRTDRITDSLYKPPS
jgi:hypothetical protein